MSCKQLRSRGTDMGEAAEPEEPRDITTPFDVLPPASDPRPPSPPHAVDGSSGPQDWMSECLTEAKRVIMTHHRYETQGFFEEAVFDLYVQSDAPHAYAHIGLGGHPVYRIGIHGAYAEAGRVPWNQRSLVVTLIHELLHAVHPDWDHRQIIPEEKRLACLAGYFDAFAEQERMFFSGRMSFCAT